MTDTKSETRKVRHTVVPLPKIVFFYPLMIVCVICAILESGAQGVALGKGVPTEGSTIAGTLFVMMFLFNIVVISFDFPGVKAMALVFMMFTGIFALLYLDSKWPVLEQVTGALKALFSQVTASTMFYCMVCAILFSMVFLGIIANFLWNRWIIESTRIFHKHGIFGDIKEYPVIDLQVEKSIDDVFEYLLLLSGTLTFSIPNAPTIRLENIPFINRVEKKIQNIVRK